MRICLVCREAATPIGEGSGRRVWEHATALSAAGHEVHVLTEPGHADPSRAALGAGIAVHAVDFSGPASIPGAYPISALRYAMGVYGTLLKLHAAYALEYIEFPSRGGEGYFALRGKRMLGQFAGAVMGVWVSTPESDLRAANMDWRFDGEAAFADHMETASLREAELLLAATQSVLDLVRERVETDSAWPLPWMAAVGLVRAARESDGAWTRPAGPATVVLPGPLEWRRGAPVFAEAARILLARGRDLKFKLVGPDTETAPIGRSVRTLLRQRYGVSDDGPVAFASEDAAKEAAVLCFAGAGPEPEWGLLDALAAGTPVAATGEPRLRAAVGNVAGLHWATPGDAASLADAIAAAVDEGAGGRAEFPFGTFVDRLIAAVESARADAAAHAPAPRPSGADVSVVVPVYNLGSYLQQTLASIDAQTLPVREVIVVDDGSTDPETLEVLAKLERDGRRVIRKPNGGVGSARNVGLRAATGRWVSFIDADDLLHPTYYEKLAGVLAGNPRLTYASAMVRCFERDPGEATAGWVPLGMAGFDRDLVVHMNVGGIAGSLFDRAALLEVGGYDEVTPSYEDWDLWCKLAARGARGAVVPEFLFYYRVREGSKYRTQGLTRHLHLKSYIIARHAEKLATGRTLRVQLAEAEGAAREMAHLRDQLEGMGRALRESQAAQVELAQRTAAAEAGVGEAWRNAGQLEEHLKRTNELLAAAQAEAQKQMRAAQEAAAADRRRAEEAEARLAAEAAERARLEERLEQTTAQCLMTADALARAHRELEAAQRALAELRQQVAAHDCWVHTRRVLAENIRYRLADRVNAVVKASGLHAAVKSIAKKAVGQNGRP